MSKQKQLNFYHNRKIYFHQVLRDGALILKEEQEHLHPANIHPERGPPCLLRFLGD